MFYCLLKENSLPLLANANEREVMKSFGERWSKADLNIQNREELQIKLKAVDDKETAVTWQL